MTKISYSKKKQYKCKVTGHAFYASHGNDIVCSAISVLCYTFSNKLLEMDEENVKIDIKEGFFEIVIDKIDHDKELLFDTMILGFKMIEEEYNKNINIKEV